MARESRFAVRTIRNGRVKIGGVWFRPQGKKDNPLGTELRFTGMDYDGRLDGMRFAFGRYRTYNPPGYLPFVELWGTEKMYRAKSEEEFHSEWMNNPSCVDGVFVWSFWDESEKG